MKLHENRNDFLDVIQATSQATGMREVFIEKDYWVCFLLKNLSESKFSNEVVFKGGTSLSKAYKIIHRFSEDVDLALLNTSTSGAEMKNKLKEIEKSIATSPLSSIEKAGVTSKGSRIRKTVWEFEKATKGEYGDASPDLLLELNSFAYPSPFSSMSIQTYIADFLISKSQVNEIKKFGLEKFPVNVLDIRRTFTEKVSALARASFGSDEKQDELKRKIRHLYDITMLIRNPIIQDFIKSGEFRKMHNEVRKNDAEISRNQRDNAEKDIRESYLFKSPKVAINDLRSTYEGSFSTLIYNKNEMPELSEITRAIQMISDNC